MSDFTRLRNRVRQAFKDYGLEQYQDMRNEIESQIDDLEARYGNWSLYGISVAAGFVAGVLLMGGIYLIAL